MLYSRVRRQNLITHLFHDYWPALLDNLLILLAIDFSSAYIC